jgi:uncharacterized protein YihD (DUF1040 family)
MTLGCAAICKNEEHNVISFLENIAQHGIINLYISDTGSSDRTVELIQSNWPKQHLWLSEINLIPFDFSVAKNSNYDKITNDTHIIHLDLDERIVGLPKNYNDHNDIIYPCTRNELLWGTCSHNMSRMTPSKNWWWEFPIHECLRWSSIYRYATKDESSDFVIDHCQVINKDFYSDLTELHFNNDPKRLFYHHICDLMRDNQYLKLTKIFDKYWDNVGSELPLLQQWQSIRNYQMSRLQINLKPREDLFDIFIDNPSQCSFLYLCFFYYRCDNIEKSKEFLYRANNEEFTDYNNRVFYNMNIKKYTSSLKF